MHNRPPQARAVHRRHPLARDDVDAANLELMRVVQQLERAGRMSRRTADAIFAAIGDCLDAAAAARRRTLSRRAVARELTRAN